MDWKDTLAQRIFPGVDYRKINENEVMSNLPLQMGLYFNVIFVPVWLIVMSVLFYDKFHCYSDFVKFVMTTVCLLTVVIEVLRLHLGFEGNLRDKIPELAGFWLLSALLQLPLQLFLLLNPHLQLRAVEKVSQGVMSLLLITQLLSGYSALKYTMKRQTIYFKIMKLKT